MDFVARRPVGTTYAARPRHRIGYRCGRPHHRGPADVAQRSTFDTIESRVARAAGVRVGKYRTGSRRFPYSQRAAACQSRRTSSQSTDPRGTQPAGALDAYNGDRVQRARTGPGGATRVTDSTPYPAFSGTARP